MILLNKKAAAGLGILVLFIALVLAAAVVAAVVLNTSHALNNKARIASKSTTQDVGTSMMLIDSIASNGEDGYLDYFETKIKIAAGSDSIRFADVLIHMTLSNTSMTYEYNSSLNCSNLSVFDNNTDQFGISYTFEGQYYSNGNLNTGDVANICFRSPRRMGVNEELKIGIIPLYGKSWDIKARTPNYIYQKYITIFP